MAAADWQKCIECLQAELPSQQFNTWIRPLRAQAEAEVLRILRQTSLLRIG